MKKPAAKPKLPRGRAGRPTDPNELNQATAQDYAAQFVADIKRSMKVKRNDAAIQAYRTRLLTSGN